MDVIRISPPFDSRALAEIAARAMERNWADVSDTVAYLLRLNDGELITGSIRSAWAASSTVLSTWSAAVQGAIVSTNEGQYSLSISIMLRGAFPARVQQQAPADGGVLAGLLTRLPVELPHTLCDLLRCAPGLTLEDTGSLASLNEVRHPLQYARRWLAGMFTSAVENPQYVDLRAQLEHLAIEIAYDGLGNAFLLGRDRRLYFMDHEECEIVPCRGDPEALIRAYLRRPQCVYDNDFLGLGR